jgi:magnesium chelatase subunit D
MVNLQDIREAAEYALPHRARENDPAPPEVELPEEDDIKQDDAGESENSESPVENSQDESPGKDTEGTAPADQSGPPDNPGNPSGKDNLDDDTQTSGDLFVIKQWQDLQSPRRKNLGAGKRFLVPSGNNQGRYVGYRLPGQEAVRDLAFDATVRAAAPFQKNRDKTGKAIAISGADIRIKVREKRTGGCILFVVDASASMGAFTRMAAVKAAVLSMLNFSYQKRDKVGLIAFRRDRAELLLGITSSVELARKKLEQLPTGGATPLARGLELAYEVIMGLRSRDAGMIPTIVLVSDGRASSLTSKDPFGEALAAAERIRNQEIRTIILDTEKSFIRLRLCEKLNQKLGGILITMEELEAEGIVAAIRHTII